MISTQALTFCVCLQPGVLMANLFRQYVSKVIKDMRGMITKEINAGSWKATGKFISVLNKTNIYKIIKSSVIENGMRYALATGNWGIKSVRTKQGVAQVLNRLTYNATLSHLRRVVSSCSCVRSLPWCTIIVY